MHAGVIACPKIESQACCLQTNSAILKRPPTLPLKPYMAKLKCPLMSQKAQVQRVDPLFFKQLLENKFYTCHFSLFLLHSAR